MDVWPFNFNDARVFLQRYQLIQHDNALKLRMQELRHVFVELEIQLSPILEECDKIYDRYCLDLCKSKSIMYNQQGTEYWVTNPKAFLFYLHTQPITNWTRQSGGEPFEVYDYYTLIILRELATTELSFRIRTVDAIIFFYSFFTGIFQMQIVSSGIQKNGGTQIEIEN